MRSPKYRKHFHGFTLAELLIALAILGVIATFTIPKVLTAQQNGQYNAIAKEDIGMVAAAFVQAQTAGNVSSSTTLGDLTQYMNYVATSTSLVVDDTPNFGSFACTAVKPCLILHNGSTLHYSTVESFGGTATTNGTWFQVDPNSTYGGTTNGPDKATVLFIYYNGKITDWGNIPTGTTSSGNPYSPTPSRIPSWFSW